MTRPVKTLSEGEGRRRSYEGEEEEEEEEEEMEDLRVLALNFGRNRVLIGS